MDINFDASHLYYWLVILLHRPSYRIWYYRGRVTLSGRFKEHGSSTLYRSNVQCKNLHGYYVGMQLLIEASTAELVMTIILLCCI